MSKLIALLRRVKRPSFDTVWRFSILVLLTWIAWSLHIVATEGIDVRHNTFQLDDILKSLESIRNAIERLR